jgi:hypothetical protein
LASFIDNVELMRKRTSMHLGGDSVLLLRAFMFGYMCAREENGSEPLGRTEDEILLGGFQCWINLKFRSKATKSWASFIEDNYKDLAETSMEAFFTLFDEYKAELTLKSVDDIKSEFQKFLESS